MRVFPGDACDAALVHDVFHAAGPDTLAVSSIGGARDRY